MFPLNQQYDQNVRIREKFKVNFAHTEGYRHSAVPYCQRLLNEDAKAREIAASLRTEEEPRVRSAEAARRREGGA